MADIRHVLCPVDFSDFSRHALHHAAALARWYGARLSVVHVYVNLPTLDLPPLALMPGDQARLLKELGEFTAASGLDVSPELIVIEAGSVQDGVLGQVAALGADLLVLGSHGRSGFERLFLGSVTEKLLRKAPCPTLVVPRRGPDAAPAAPVRFRRILCPVDFSGSSLDAAALAFSLAEEADAQLTLLHVVEIPPGVRSEPGVPGLDLERFQTTTEGRARQRMEALVPAGAREYCTVHTSVADGSAHREILRVAGEQTADLIVMGVRGRGAVDLMLFGSTSHHVIRAATCPVLVVRGA